MSHTLNPSPHGRQQAAALAAVHAELARRSLWHFVRAAWPVVEPAVPFVDGWHIGLVCEYLQAVLDLEINALIINLPPRHMKSLLASVFFPAYAWVHQPGLTWLGGSFALPLAVRDAQRTRRLIGSEWYKAAFSTPFKILHGHDQKHRYQNDHGGGRLAFGFNSAITGEGGDVLLVDDPLRMQDADNPNARRRVNTIYDQAITTRSNDPMRVRRVIMMQRLHEDDLTGHLLATQPGRYQHLCLPAEYAKRMFLPLQGRSDKRRTVGAPLWPQRFGPAQLKEARQALGERAYAGQYLQRPYADGGNIYRAAWWQGRNRYTVGQGPQPIARYLSWDTALKEGQDNDASALAVLELTPTYQLRLRHSEWGRYDFPRLAHEIEQQAMRWNSDGLLRGVLIEDKASGISALQTLSQAAPMWLARLLRPVNPGSVGKEGRARQASLWCERGCVLLPNPSEQVPWLYDFEEGLYRFPAATLNDPADAFTQSVLYLENLLAEGWRAAVQRPIIE